MAEAEKPRSQSTRVCLKSVETKLQNRRPRSPTGTPIAHAEHKANSEKKDGNIIRKSRSFSDPDLYGGVKIYRAEGLFSLVSTQPNTTKSINNTNTTMERPMCVSSWSNITSKLNVASIKANFEQQPNFFDISHKQHMAEFTNPLHKESKPSCQEEVSGSIMAVKLPVAPKPATSEKPDPTSKKPESPAKNNKPPAKKPEPPAKKPEPPAKKPEPPVNKPEPPAKKTEHPSKKSKSSANGIESAQKTSDQSKILNGKPLLYEEISPTQPESLEYYSSDEDNGLYSKIVHHSKIKPIPSHPPPRRPFISDVEYKQPVKNSVTEQEAEKDMESEKLPQIPIYAKVNKQKSKTLDHVEESGIITKTRSITEQTPSKIVRAAEKRAEVSGTGEEMDSSDNVEKDDSDFDDDEPWDSDEFDCDFDENEEDKDSSLQDKQEDAMVFPDEKSKKLYNIAKEILTTEKAYVKRLYLLDKVFCFRLKNECLDHGHIPPEVLQDVFSNISAIHTLHKDFFLPKLEERMSEWSTNDRIGDILKTLAPFLKLYTAYIANFDKSSETLTTWSKKSQQFAAVIEDIQKSNKCENLTLGHHMLEPIQRVPRYKLLLRDYLSKLPEDSPDYKNCQDALEIISEAAAHANDSMKKMERFKKLLELQDRLLENTDLITASRQFIKEGDLTKVAARSSAGHQERTLLLFNDLLLCCAKLPGTNKLKVKVKMDIDGMEIGEPEEDEDVVLSNTFRVTSKQKVMDFSASSEEDKENWTKALKESIEELSRKRESYKRGDVRKPISESDLGKKAPVWVRDESTTMCMLCDTMFTITRRRHHCRSCGRIFCQACCHYKAVLEYTGGKQKRVCQTCYEIIVRGAKGSLIKKKVEEKKNFDPRKISGQTKVLLSSYLNYKGGSEKNWVKRWCVLSDNFVFYCYKAKKDTKAAFSVPLPGYVVDKPNRLADDIDKEFAFKIHYKNMVVYFFEADGKELLQRWMHNLSFAVKAERIPETEEELANAPADEETEDQACRERVSQE